MLFCVQYRQMDFKQTSREVIRNLRGKRSQLQLSQKLGFRGNQIYRWESGQRDVAWTDFLRLSRACRKDVLQSLHRVFGPQAQIDDARALVYFLIGESTLISLSRETGISRQALSRWLKGQSEPSLAQVFLLVHHCHHVLHELLQELVEGQACPQFKLSPCGVDQKKNFITGIQESMLFCVVSSLLLIKDCPITEKVGSPSS